MTKEEEEALAVSIESPRCGWPDCKTPAVSLLVSTPCGHDLFECGPHAVASRQFYLKAFGIIGGVVWCKICKTIVTDVRQVAI